MCKFCLLLQCSLGYGAWHGAASTKTLSYLGIFGRLRFEMVLTNKEMIKLTFFKGSQFTSHLIRNLDLKNVFVETVGSSEDEPITVSQPRLGLPR